MSEVEWTERERRLTRIRRVSAFMKWSVTLLLVAIVLLGIVIAIGISLPQIALIEPQETIDIATIERPIGEIPQIQRIAIAGLFTVALLILTLAAWNMRQVFKRFQQMEFFSPKTLANIIGFGTWLIVFAVFDIISDPLGSVVLTYDYPPGQRQLDLALDGGEVFFLVLGALMLLFGWILREAALIADENRQFI